MRYEDRVLVRAQVQCRNQVLLGYEYRRPVRGPSMGPERWLLQRQERMLCPALCRPQERGPVRGQGLPQPCRGRWQVGTKSEARGERREGRVADADKSKGRSQRPKVKTGDVERERTDSGFTERTKRTEGLVTLANRA